MNTKLINIVNTISTNKPIFNALAFCDNGIIKAAKLITVLAEGKYPNGE